MRGSARRAGRLLQRLGRLLLGRNALRRPSDRIEGAAHLRPAVAVLSQPGPVARAQAAAAQARWRLPNGTERSGALTTVTVPAIYYAPAGTPVRVWLDRSGEPVAPPPSPGDMIFNALFAGITATACSAVALILCYPGPCRGRSRYPSLEAEPDQVADGGHQADDEDVADQVRHGAPGQHGRAGHRHGPEAVDHPALQVFRQADRRLRGAEGDRLDEDPGQQEVDVGDPVRQRAPQPQDRPARR